MHVIIIFDKEKGILYLNKSKKVVEVFDESCIFDQYITAVTSARSLSNRTKVVDLKEYVLSYCESIHEFLKNKFLED